MLARPLARLLAALRVLEPVGAEAQLAGAAVDERVGEAGDMARRLPHARVEDHRRVERDDVVALLHHRLEPVRADVVLQQDAVVPVVVRRAEPAVDLRRREHEAAPPAERHDLVHRHRPVSAAMRAQVTGAAGYAGDMARTPAIAAAERAGIGFTLHEYAHDPRGGVVRARGGREARRRSRARVQDARRLGGRRARGRLRSRRGAARPEGARQARRRWPTRRAEADDGLRDAAASARSASGSACRPTSTSRRSSTRRSWSAPGAAASRSSSRRDELVRLTDASVHPIAR